jgi:hypothetical protein
MSAPTLTPTSSAPTSSSAGGLTSAQSQSGSTGDSLVDRAQIYTWWQQNNLFMSFRNWQCHRLFTIVFRQCPWDFIHWGLVIGTSSVIETPSLQFLIGMYSLSEQIVPIRSTLNVFVTYSLSEQSWVPILSMYSLSEQFVPIRSTASCTPYQNKTILLIRTICSYKEYSLIRIKPYSLSEQMAGRTPYQNKTVLLIGIICSDKEYCQLYSL